MQGISAKDHENMLAAFSKYEKLFVKASTKIPEIDSIKAREGMAELENIYQNFRALLSELEQCTKRYDSRCKVVRSLIYKSIRKMNADFKKEKRFQ